MLVQAEQKLKAAISNTCIMNIDDKGGVDTPEAKPCVVMGGCSVQQLHALVDLIGGDSMWDLAQDIRALIAAKVAHSDKLSTDDERWIGYIKEMADGLEKKAVALKMSKEGA